MSLRSFMHQAKNLQVYSYCICGCSAWKRYNTIIILHECVIVIVASFAFHSHWEINGILDRLKGWIQKFIENIFNIRNVDDATRFLEHLASKINEDLMQALAYEVYIFNTIASMICVPYNSKLTMIVNNQNVIQYFWSCYSQLNPSVDYKRRTKPCLSFATR